MLKNMVLLSACIFLFPLGCDDAERVCDPGKTDVCLCAGGSQGVQSCSNDGTGWGKCNCGEAPLPDVAGTPDVVPSDQAGCTPNVEFDKQCYENAVFWFDDCGKRLDLVESCKTPEEMCLNGVCDAGSGCQPNDHKGCEGNAIWWYDSCNEKGELVETCGENTVCGNAECQESCTVHAYKGCSGSDVYWFDSCGVEETLAELCADTDFCLDDACVKPSYQGTWSVITTDPPDPLAPFQPFVGILETIDDVVTLKEPNPFKGVEGQPDYIAYSGSITGKLMQLSGSYTDLSGNEYITNITVTFSVSPTIGSKVPPDYFEGSYIQVIPSVGIQLLYNIAGTKQ